MHHFGLTCPPAPSHVTALVAIGAELRARGHAVTMFNIADAQPTVTAGDLNFIALGLSDHPKGSLGKFTDEIGRRKGLGALRYGLRAALSETEMLLREAPDAMKKAGISALIVDQGQLCGSSIAERMGVPFFTFCNAVAGNRDPSVPPTMTAWPYSTAWPARLRNRVANQLFDFALTPFLRKINRWRGCWNLPPIRSLEDTFSPLAQFSQETTDFDFPNASLPPTFHHIGLIERLPAAADFPFHRLNGKPLIYCSFGTLNNGLQWLDVDMTHAREVMNVLRAEGIRVTYGHIIVRAVALALAALPDFHVLVCRLRRHRPARVDIALSVGGDTIAAPVMIIEGADGKSLHDLAAEIANRTPETREANKRGIERLSRWGWLVPFGFLRRAFIRTLLSSITVRRRMLGTFQVSILPDVDFCATSMFGTSAILTAGRVKDRPVIVDGQIVIRPMVTLTCCGDHRVFDGKAASNFLNVVRTSLESMGSISAQR